MWKVCRPADAAGFTMMETLMVIAIGAILAGMTIISVDQALRNARGNNGLAGVMSQLRMARDTAVSQRRSVQVEFINPNEIRLTRMEIPGGTTLVNEFFLEGNVQYLQFGGVPDTPDGFGAASPVDFGGQPTTFTAEGMLVDPAGTPLSGSVFLGIANEPTSARAVTVFGGTGRVRGYTWNGTAWVE